MPHVHCWTKCWWSGRCRISIDSLGSWANSCSQGWSQISLAMTVSSRELAPHEKLGCYFQNERRMQDKQKQALFPIQVQTEPRTSPPRCVVCAEDSTPIAKMMTAWLWCSSVSTRTSALLPERHTCLFCLDGFCNASAEGNSYINRVHCCVSFNK